MTTPVTETRPHPLFELTRARMLEFFREPGMIFWVFGFPILLAIGLGLAFRSTPPERPAIAVVAAADNALGRAVVASDELSAVNLPEDEALQGLARTRYALLLDLRGPEPTFRYDPMLRDSRLARALSGDVLERAAGRKDLLAPKEVRQSLPGTRYIDFLLPGLIGMNIMGSSVWGVGYSLVVARKRKLLRRFAVTGMRRSHYLLSYFLSRMVFLVLELGVLVTFGALVFGTTVQGSYALLALMALLGAAAFAGLGLLVGARIDNTEVATGWMNFIQLPMWVLSGAYFTNEKFPEWMQPMIQGLPLTALVDGLRGIYGAGMGITGILGEMGILLAWGVGGFLVAGKRFRWT